MRSRNTAILAAGLCLGILVVSSIAEEQPELNGTSFNGIVLNGANLNGANLNGANLNGVVLNSTQVSEQSRSTVSSEVARSTTIATLNHVPIQAINLEGGQLIFRLDTPQ